MHKNTIVNLVLLNSLLVLSGCGRCATEEKIDDKGNKVATGCTGGRGRGGARFFPYTTGTGFGSSTPSGTGSRTGSTGSVSRGGFGSSGGAVS